MLLSESFILWLFGQYLSWKFTLKRDFKRKWWKALKPFGKQGHLLRSTDKSSRARITAKGRSSLLSKKKKKITTDRSKKGFEAESHDCVWEERARNRKRWGSREAAFQNRMYQRKARAGREGQVAWGTGYSNTGCFGVIHVDQVNHVWFQWKDKTILHQLSVKHPLIFL